MTSKGVTLWILLSALAILTGLAPDATIRASEQTRQLRKSTQINTPVLAWQVASLPG
jgi:hypothetical protein